MNQFQMIVEQIEKSNNIAIFSHLNTDGDAIGSSLALKSVLESQGKTADVFIDSTIASNLLFLPGISNINIKRAKTYDLAIALDSADSTRIGAYEQNFYAIKNTIQFDHHLGNPNYSKINYIRSEASSVCFLLYDFFTKCNYQITKDAAICLITGILTDTGGLRFSNTEPEDFFAVGNLIKDYNVEIDVINKLIFESFSISYHDLYKHAFNNTKFYENNQIAMIFLGYKDFEESKISPDEAKNLTRIGTELEPVKITIVVSEKKKGEFFVSFRSRGKIDVRRCAETFGGGGHISASGCRMYGNPETVKEKLLKSAMDALV